MDVEDLPGLNNIVAHGADEEEEEAENLQENADRPHPVGPASRNSILDVSVGKT